MNYDLSSRSFSTNNGLRFLMKVIIQIFTSRG